MQRSTLTAIGGNQPVDIRSITIRKLRVMNKQNILGVESGAARKVETAGKNLIVANDNFIMHKVMLGVGRIRSRNLAGEISRRMIEGGDQVCSAELGPRVESLPHLRLIVKTVDGLDLGLVNCIVQGGYDAS